MFRTGPRPLPRLPLLLAALAALVLLAGGALRAVLRSAPRTEAPPGLEVALGSPRGDVPELAAIDVVFNEPMIPLGSRRSAKTQPPLEITPPIPGSFTWIGTRALSFVPRGSVPPGTHLVCRVPRETRSLDGNGLVADYVWEIVVDRPRLLRSVPEPGERIAPDEPLALLFSQPPADAAAGMVRLESAEGSIEMERVRPDSAVIAALAEGLLLAAAQVEAATLLLRPKRTLDAARSYRLEIPQDLAFAGTDVGLTAPVAILFATYGPPHIVRLAADTGGIDLALAGPVDPDTLARYLSASPPIAHRKILALSGTTLRVEGRLRAGRTHTLTLAAGLPSLLGARLDAPEQRAVEVPHREPLLDLIPEGGFLPGTEEARMRIRATNVDTVQVYGAWVPADSMPARLARHSEGGRSARLTRLALWSAPRRHTDSTLAVDLSLERFGKRPARARAIEMRVRARALFANEDGERPTFRQEGLVQITDLGVSSFVGAERGLAWVTRLSTGQPVAGAEVRIHVPGAVKPLWTGTTDGDGMAWLPGRADLGARESSPIIVEARTEEDGVWLLAMRRGMHIRTESEDERVVTVTDRPLYRPGEEARWVAFARRSGREGIRPSGLGSLGYVVRSGYPEKILARGSFPIAPPGNGSGSFHIPETAAPGSFEIVLYASADVRGEPIGWQSFRVEEFRLPRFEARLRVIPDLAFSGEPVTVEGRFRYLSGGPLASAPVRWTLQRHPDWSAPEGYWDFSFRDDRIQPPGVHNGWAARIGSGEAKLDRDGGIRLPVTPSLAGLGQDQVYVLEMGARDLTDRSAYDVVSFRAQRAAVRAGARLRNLLADREQALEVAAAVFDTSDAPAPGIAMRWQIERRDWKSVRIRRIGGIFGYENVPRDTVLARGETLSTGGPTIVLWKPPGPGSYSLLVQATDREGRETRARAETYVAGEEAAAWYREDRPWLDLKPDRESYLRGDTARVLLPAPAIPTEGIALVLDDGILRAQRLARVQGSPSLPIALADAMPGAIWLAAVLVGPTVVPGHDGRTRRLPYYAWGQTPLTIRADESRLKVTVEPERSVYRPGEEVALSIRLRDALGHPVAGTVTLAVVDDAIFELYGDDTPDPLAFFTSFRGPGIVYEDVRQALSPPPLGEKGTLTPGGDGGLDSGTALRRRFLPTVHWEALVPVGSDGAANLRFPLADDLTRYRMRVIATSGTDRFGYGEGKLEVRKPLMLEWGLPRFARDGDRVVVSAVVRAEGTEPVKVRVRAQAQGARFEGKQERKVTVRPPEASRVEFTLKEPDVGGVVLRLSAKGDVTADAAELALPIDRPVLWDRDFAAGRIEAGARTIVETEPGILVDRGGLTTTLSPSMLSGLETAIDYVTDYPYACLEQLSSSLLGLVAQSTVQRHLGRDDAAQVQARSDHGARIVRQIERCASAWELRAWPAEAGPPASHYTAGYALLAAARARRSDLPVPRALVDRLAREAAERLARLWSGHEGAQVERGILADAPWLLYALSVAEEGRPPDSSLVSIEQVEALFARRSHAPLESRILLGLAIANLRGRGDAEPLRASWPAMAGSLLGEIRERDTRRTGRHVWVEGADPSWGDGIGGDVRASAFYLALLAIADPSDVDLPGIVAWLIDQRRPSSGAWINNHASALALDIVSTAVSALEGPPSEVSGRLEIDGAFEEFRFGGPASTLEKFTPIADFQGAGGGAAQLAVEIETDGRRAVYLTTSLDQARPAMAAAAREEGFILEREYVDAQGVALGERIPVGEPLFVHLTLVVSRDTKTLLVEDPLPGGIEPLQLLFRNTPRISMSEEPEEDRAERLWIIHRELTDRSVRLFAEGVKEGIYHIYYPAIATTSGIYHVPGARAEAMYSPEIYATSDPRVVDIGATR